MAGLRHNGLFLNPITVAPSSQNGEWIIYANAAQVYTKDPSGGIDALADIAYLEQNYTSLVATHSLTGQLHTLITVTSGGVSDTIGTGTTTIVAQETIVPNTSGTRDLGSVSNPWRDIYLMNSTIHMGGSTIGVSGTISGSKIMFNGALIENSAYSKYTIQVGSFSDPGGEDGDIVYVI
jgi:hypothetical protein